MTDMAEWTKEQADFLVKIGQLPPVTSKQATTKKDEE